MKYDLSTNLIQQFFQKPHAYIKSLSLVNIYLHQFLSLLFLTNIKQNLNKTLVIGKTKSFEKIAPVLKLMILPIFWHLSHAQIWEWL
jgi:hypothetical protein